MPDRRSFKQLAVRGRGATPKAPIAEPATKTTIELRDSLRLRMRRAGVELDMTNRQIIETALAAWLDAHEPHRP